MVLEPLLDLRILRGLLFAALGVAFWIAGPVIAYFLWKRWRGPDGQDG